MKKQARHPHTGCGWLPGSLSRALRRPSGAKPFHPGLPYPGMSRCSAVCVWLVQEDSNWAPALPEKAPGGLCVESRKFVSGLCHGSGIRFRFLSRLPACHALASGVLLCP